MLPNRTGFIYIPDYLNHLTGTGHPESPQRLTSIVNRLQKSPMWEKLEKVSPTSANPEIIKLVHPDYYIEHVKTTCDMGYSYLDSGDTGICVDSHRVALLAVGGMVEAIDGLFTGKLHTAFCAVRPPGHHAEVDTAMGFCLFNNVAIAARYAQSRYEIQKVLILDWDVHHGNGTQHIFERDPNIFYISIHQYPFYPGTGSQEETGYGEGLGTTINFPLSVGCGDKEYLDIFQNKIPDIVMKFSPELIILSAGFDAHQLDPMAGMELSTDAYREMTQIMVKLAKEVSNGKLLSSLEGGYNLTALAESVETHLMSLGQYDE